MIPACDSQLVSTTTTTTAVVGNGVHRQRTIADNKQKGPLWSRQKSTDKPSKVH
jgi:hypothetical protein